MADAGAFCWLLLGDLGGWLVAWGNQVVAADDFLVLVLLLTEVWLGSGLV